MLIAFFLRNVVFCEELTALLALSAHASLSVGITVGIYLALI